jgi:hypothetical protein
LGSRHGPARYAVRGRRPRRTPLGRGVVQHAGAARCGGRGHCGGAGSAHRVARVLCRTVGDRRTRDRTARRAGRGVHAPRTE